MVVSTQDNNGAVIYVLANGIVSSMPFRFPCFRCDLEIRERSEKWLA